jgi:uncharacterized protein with FMN-binding domain
MRRLMVWFGSTVVALVLLFSYRTSTSGPSGSTAVASGTQAPGVVPDSSAPSSRSTTKPGSGSAGSRGAETVNGSVSQTVWGPVQVQVHIDNGRIVDVQALIYPTGSGRDQAINSYALPQLRQQALQAQSAQIDGVSGATVTSDGYRESLQAALDAAHFPS